MKNGRFWMALAGAMALGFVATGCSQTPRMGTYNVTVTSSEQLRDPASGKMISVEVDIVGVSETERAQWSDKPLSEYFTPGDSLRQYADKHTMGFTNETPQPRTLSAGDPIWGKWSSSSAHDLFILANLPGMADQPGDRDGRRLILPLDKARWNDKVIKVEIMPSGLKLRSEMKPLKQ